ncbi:MAG: DEAD/DEAH box helicase [Phycisphaerae bacterium]
MDGIAFAVGAGRAILADDMGLGKTIQGIGVAELLAREVNIRKVLIVCPTSLKSQWRSEIHRFSNRDCQLILGGAAERATQYDNDRFFTICNYEQVMRDILSIEKVKWDLIILDEGQRIKNWETKTSHVIKGLKSPFALVLTGTPLENRLDDLFSVAEFIHDRRLGPAFRFFNRHRITDETGYVLGYKNLGELRARLKPVLLRRTRDLVMKQLPPRTTEIVRIAPTAEQLELHKNYSRIIRSIVTKPYITEMDLLRLKQALMLCRMSADSTYLVDKMEPGYSSKLETLDNLLEQLVAEENRKILLFSEWTTMLNLIEPLLNKRKIAFVRLDRSIPQKKRQPLVNAFQNDPRIKVFITTNAGATGLNLQAANTVINVDLPWNPAVLEQRISRAHRMGQKQPVQVFVLVTQATIEENLLGTLSAKHDLAIAALDPQSDVSQVDLMIGIDELKRRLEVLIGARPYAPVDESERRRVTEEAERLAQAERIGSAGGQLLTAALGFISELLPERPPTPESDEMLETLRARLAECITQDEKGQHKLNVTLGDGSAVNNLLDALARLLSFKG